MEQTEFNRQMGAYIRERKKEKSVFSRIKPRVTVVDDDKPEPPLEVSREHVDAVLRGERLVEEDDFEESRVERPRFWKRVFGWISLGDEVASPVQDDVDVGEIVNEKPRSAVDADVKEMLRICVHWVNMLPPEQLQDIKRSDDFDKFKRLLDKYGLIKKK